MAGKPKTGVFYGWVVVAAASVILALQWGFHESFGIFFTELYRDLALTRTEVSGSYALFYVVSSTLGILTGRLNDKYGPRLMLTISVIVISIGCALMSVVNTLWQLYVVYGVIIAVGASFGWVPVIATVCHWFVKKRGMALGITKGATGIGMFIMPPLSQFLIIKLGWRISYLIIAGLICAVGLPASRFTSLDPAEKGLYPDNMEGTVKNTGNDKRISNIRDFTIKQAVRTKQFWLLFALSAIFALPFGIWVHLKAYMVGFGISEMTAANVIGLSGAAYVVGVLVINYLSDRIGRKKPLIISLLLMGLMMLWLLRAREPWEFYVFSIIIGFFWGGLGLFSAIIADWFGLKFLGSIFGILDASWGIGAGISPVLAGYIFDTTGSYQLSIIMGAVVIFITAGLALLLRHPGEPAGTVI
jgi:OFA family oxalate/formate antiporter-like MFS transporter